MIVLVLPATARAALLPAPALTPALPQPRLRLLLMAEGGHAGRGGRGGRRAVATSPPPAGDAAAASRKSRKAAITAKAQAQVEAKLAADASFFWECVQKHQLGVDIRGACGKDPEPRDATTLFGHASPPPAAGLNFEQYDAIPVTRSGAGASEADVPPLGSSYAAARESGALVLPPFAMRNLLDAERMGIASPTPIQRHTVPLALTAGHDVMGCAQTGSGKTMAFLLPLIASVAAQQPNAATGAAAASRTPAVRGVGGGSGGRRGVTGRLGAKEEAAVRARGTPAKPSALVLAPTRELAMQIELECAKLTCDAPPPPSGAGHWCGCCYGGATARPQLETLAAGVEVLVATPGRLADFVRRDLVSLRDCRFLVLDEADRMLDMGFEPQIRRIVEGHDLPPNERRQTLLFSATFAPPIQRVAASYLREPYAHVAVGRVGSSIETITQRLVLAEQPDKRSKLSLLLPLITGGERTIVFVQKKHVASWVRDQLRKSGVACADIHGDRSQGQREAALAKFRSGEVDVLVATDVASRGIDVPEVAHVVQFDLPVSRDEMDSYVHRIGRTGRAGREGRATALFVPGDDPKTGNGPLWPDLARLLDENAQEVPGWFDALRPKGAQPRAAAVGGGGGTAGAGGAGRSVRAGGGAEGHERAVGRGGRGGRGRGRGGRGGRGNGGATPRARSATPASAPATPAAAPRKVGAAARGISPAPPSGMNRKARRAAAAAAAGRAPNAGPLPSD